MTILLQQLIKYSWVLYVACAVGFAAYAIRALGAWRERNVAQFTLERETASTKVAQSWMIALIFVAIGAAVFASVTFILPNLDIHSSLPTPTLAAGLETTASVSTLTPSPTMGFEAPTLTPTAVDEQPPTLPPQEATETPTPEASDVPEAAVTGDVNIRFSNFAKLASYSLPASEVTTAQPLPLTIQWQALEETSPVDYWVFIHLLAEDGRLIAQHDGSPASGSRPTTGWNPGQVIVDQHLMTFQDTAYTGPTHIAVGLYDPSEPGNRIPTETGNDHVVLPVTVNVIP